MKTDGHLGRHLSTRHWHAVNVILSAKEFRLISCSLHQINHGILRAAIRTMSVD
jgi:hypothetical protein